MNTILETDRNNANITRRILHPRETRRTLDLAHARATALLLSRTESHRLLPTAVSGEPLPLETEIRQQQHQVDL